MTAVRLAVLLGLSLAAGALAALPSLIVGSRERIALPPAWIPELLAAVPAATIGLALLAMLGILVLGEHFAVASTDRSPWSGNWTRF